MESPAASADLLGAALPLRTIGPMAQGGEPGRHFGANLRVGQLMLTAAIATSTRLLLNRHSGLTAVLGYGGDLRIRQARRFCHCPQDGLLLLCGEPCVWEGESWSVVAFQLLPEPLLSACRSMADGQDLTMEWKRLLHANHLFEMAAADATAPLQRALRQLIAISIDLEDQGETLLDRLRLDEQIQRLVVALLLPDLRRSGPLERVRSRAHQAHDPFSELLAYIQEHLAEPLNLTELETHSHYSRRALQYTFQQRLGCTPSQWIRGQRLDRARGRLERPQLEDSVTSIARDCGYRSMNLFSLDFQQRFHIKPSQLLREARASKPW